MRLITSSLVAAGTVAGLAAAVVTYQAGSGAPETVQRSVAAPVAAPVVEPTVVTTFLPCEEGTELVDDTCVRTEHRTIIRQVPGPSGAAGTPQASDPAPVRAAAANGPGQPAANVANQQPAAAPAAVPVRQEDHESDHSDDHEGEDAGEVERDHSSEHDGDHEGDHDGDHEGDH